MSKPRGDREWDPAIDHLGVVSCGRCKRPVPTGGAHLVVDGRGSPGNHLMYCAGCCPCRRRAEG